ncbi:Scr1 family TA system antitoxin-like transcriptional regulator [Glycomyces tarimensis]
MATQDMGSWFLRTAARKGRKATGRSQRQVGDEVDRSTDTVRAWEQGRTDIPLQAIEALARACGMSNEIAMYMRKVAKARKNGHPIEADMRFNALFIALAEEYSGDIFKWDATLIPGPLQTEAYHYTVVRLAEQATDEQLNRGWAFKTQRRKALEARKDNPQIKFLLGETAMLQLRQVSEQLYREQTAYLTECAERPGWEIQILTEPVPGREGTFEIYKPGGSELSCPSFVYIEVHDSSWCIDDPVRIESYDEFRKKRWHRAIRIEDYRYDD